jgi:WD40 repeat protein
MEKLSSNIQNEITSISFNQDFSLISMTTERGFKIYNTSSINHQYDKNLYGGLSKCELSYKSNYLALIGGGIMPKFNNKKVVIYNDAQDIIESEYKFTTPVINVKVKKDFLFIVCEKKIFVFNINNSQNIDCFDTVINKKGLIAVNGCPNKTIMAYPIEFNTQTQKSYVSIKNYKTLKCFPQMVQDDPISYIAMDYLGLLLSTSNEKGTIIRIHSCKDGSLLQECRRGKEKAEIIYIAFDMDYKYMGVSSDRKTIHLWKLDNIIERKKKEKSVSSKNIVNFEKNIYSHKKSISDINFYEKEEINEIKIKDIKNYKTESSFAKIRMNEPYCIFCFKPKDIVIIISIKGNYYKALIDKKGGDCLIFGEKNLINNNETKNDTDKKKKSK